MYDLLDDACPVSLDLLGALYRADDEGFDSILSDLSESMRAKLAVYLYGRSHTYALGIRVAADCDGSSLRRAGGLVGNALYEQSRQPVARVDQRRGSAQTRMAITLGGKSTAGLRSAL